MYVHPGALATWSYRKEEEDPLFLKMEAVCFSEALTIYITTRHNIPYDVNFHQPCFVNPNVPEFFVFNIAQIMFPRCQHKQLKFDFGWEWGFYVRWEP
jgi:hypothetical protein